MESERKGKAAFTIRAILPASSKENAEISPLKIEPDTSLYGAISHYQIIARDGNESYRIKVTLPSDYSPEKKYKALYYLDGWWLSETILGTNTLLSLSRKIEPLILVGIANTGGFDDWHRQRSMDLIPSKLTKENTKLITILQHPKYMAPDYTGGAAQFLDFMESSIMPQIEAAYSVQSGESGIIGHSFGGLFGFYSLQTKPELFKNHLLISPSLWWEAAEIINDNKLKRLARLEGSHNLFIAYGTDEARILVDPIKRLETFLDTASVKTLEYQLTHYENRDHNSVIPPSLYDGLMFLYKKRKGIRLIDGLRPE